MSQRVIWRTVVIPVSQEAAAGVREPAFGHESPTSPHPETETPSQKTLHDNDDCRELVEGQQA